MDDHVRDWHHYELTAWRRTEGSLDDHCKIDLFDGGEPLVRDRNKRRLRLQTGMDDRRYPCLLGRTFLPLERCKRTSILRSRDSPMIEHSIQHRELTSRALLSPSPRSAEVALVLLGMPLRDLVLLP